MVVSPAIHSSPRCVFLHKHMYVSVCVCVCVSVVHHTLISKAIAFFSSLRRKKGLVGAQDTKHEKASTSSTHGY